MQRLSADKPSLGVFELGGASMQVTFALTEPSDAAEVIAAARREPQRRMGLALTVALRTLHVACCTSPAVPAAAATHAAWCALVRGVSDGVAYTVRVAAHWRRPHGEALESVCAASSAVCGCTSFIAC